MPYKHLYIYQIKGVINESGITTPDYIGCWNEGTSSFLFFKTDQKNLVKALVEAQPQLTLVDSYDMDYENWQGGNLKPFRVGPLWFCPSNENTGQKPEECKVISFDPGVVFGTGLHPTTYDSLYLIVDLFKQYTPERVLDLGTGTGILALACAALGAKKVHAVDINRLAVKTAKKNVLLNGFEKRVTVSEMDAATAIKEDAVLALMNMHYEILSRLMDMEAFGRKKWIILSGLLRTEYMKSLRKLQKRLHLVKERSTGYWFSAWFEA